MANRTFLVSGMTCDGCVRAVTNAIQRAIPGASVEVDLATGKLTIGVDAEVSTVSQAIEDAGFEFDGAA